MADKGFKQDVIVSIRYRNDLPPPPMAPKFLDIDTGGLAQYLTTSYASALARREEPNIDVDAEGGMPIDMIGIPGYFLGDESAIMAPDIAPPLEPADQALMLTAEQLKSQGGRNNVSFLRKTQYMTSAGVRANAGDPLARATPRRKASNSTPSAVALEREDKENIKKHIQKGFDVAYPESIPYNPAEARSQPSSQAEREAWRHPVHPDNPRLTPVSFYPVLPDLDATNDQSSRWYRFKYEKPPLPVTHGKRDERVDVAIFHTHENRALEAKWLADKRQYEKDPRKYNDPGPQPVTFNMLIPKQPDYASKIRKSLYEGIPEQTVIDQLQGIAEDCDDGQPRVPFERVRTFNAVTQKPADMKRFMALGLYDPASDSVLDVNDPKRAQGPAAYYYPIGEDVRFAADRTHFSQRGTATQEEQQEIDVINVGIGERNATQNLERATFRGMYDYSFVETYDTLRKEQEAEEEQARAQETVDEQGTVEDGQADVTMEEVRDAENAGVGLNGVGEDPEDDDRGGVLRAGTPGLNGTREASEDAMDDD